MLAYVFWHWPRPEVDPRRYADGLVAFHRALRSAPPAGFRGSRIRAVSGAPWLPVPRAFEDWYLVEDFTALGALEQAAVRGRALEPHDRAAGMALGGAGGLYGLLRQGENPAPDRAAWFGKPPGVRYPDFLAEVREGELWQRKLVLGPAPEFCLTGGSPPVEAVQPIVLGVETIPPGE